jgi:hypothetical protein
MSLGLDRNSVVVSRRNHGKATIFTACMVSVFSFESLGIGSQFGKGVWYHVIRVRRDIRIQTGSNYEKGSGREGLVETGSIMGLISRRK